MQLKCTVFRTRHWKVHGAPKKANRINELNKHWQLDKCINIALADPGISERGGRSLIHPSPSLLFLPLLSLPLPSLPLHSLPFPPSLFLFPPLPFPSPWKSPKKDWRDVGQSCKLQVDINRQDRRECQTQNSTFSRSYIYYNVASKIPCVKEINGCISCRPSGS